jgi:MoaA/NifB/PqqE/SkfB family radical SAM enzyme
LNISENKRKTIEALGSLRDSHPNLIVGLKTTILPQNIDELGKISEFADSRGLFTIISPCIITEGRYLNPDRAADLSFSPQDVDRMIEFFSSDQFRWSFHADSLVDFYKTGTMKKPCSCGFNYLFIRSSGEVFLCPLIRESVGNITAYDISELFYSKTAGRMRKKIGEMPKVPKMPKMPKVDVFYLFYNFENRLCCKRLPNSRSNGKSLLLSGTHNPQRETRNT